MEIKIKIISFILLTSLYLLFLLGCQSSTKTIKNESLKEKPERFSNQLIIEAEKYIGIPYCYGGNTTKCLDCSGFVNLVFSKFGIILPRTASDIYDITKKVSIKEAKTGDLLFFKSKSKVDHIGIYIEKGEFIHASSSKGVTKNSLSENYYSKNFYGAGRIILGQP